MRLGSVSLRRQPEPGRRRAVTALWSAGVLHRATRQPVYRDQFPGGQMISRNEFSPQHATFGWSSFVTLGELEILGGWLRSEDVVTFTVTLGVWT